MLGSIVWLLVGLVLLLGGGDLLVRGASGLARHFGVSALVIGLTVVAFGTSAPELSVNIIGAMEGKSDISFGNVIGSNLANIGLVLGLTALVRPLTIHGTIIVREIPLMLLGTTATVILILDPLLRDAAPVIDRSDGCLLLLLFTIFLYSAIGDVVRNRRSDPLVAQAEHFTEPVKTPVSLLVNVLLVGAGLAALVYGGDRTVAAAADIAQGLGVPDVVIGLLLVAVGTSLPELATSIVAVRRGETDIAVGNIVGSNVFNLLLVLGTTAVVRDVPVPKGGLIDVLAVLVLSFVLVPMCMTYDRRLVRREGVLLFGGWSGYCAWRFLTG